MAFHPPKFSLAKNFCYTIFSYTYKPFIFLPNNIQFADSGEYNTFQLVHFNTMLPNVLPGMGPTP